MKFPRYHGLCGHRLCHHPTVAFFGKEDHDLVEVAARRAHILRFHGLKNGGGTKKKQQPGVRFASVDLLPLCAYLRQIYDFHALFDGFADGNAVDVKDAEHQVN